MKAEARHQMKRDEFVNVFTRVTMAIAENPKQATIVVVIVAVLGALFAGLTYLRSYENAKANTLFEQGLTSFNGARPDASTTAGAQPDYAAALASFDKVGNSLMSPLKDPARLMAAVCEIRLGKTAEAHARLSTLSSAAGGTFYARMAKLIDAENLYEQGKFAEAARVYAELAQTTDPNFPTDYALLAAGRAQAKAGDRTSALASFKKLKVQFPLSAYGQQADEETRRIAPETAED